MAGSSLSFISTSSFRNSLLAKNLAPYNIPGVYSPQVGQTTYETQLSVTNVIDSPGELITNDPYAQQLYPLNSYGPDGGYNLNITYNTPPLPVSSNKGEYDPTDTILDIVNEFFIDAAFIENRYGPEGGFNDMVIIDSIQNNNKIYLPYWDPPTFTPSTYTPYEILSSDNPVGDEGPLSNDSYIAKLGAQNLKNLFKDRINTEIYKNTVGLVNLESLSDPFEASLIATGREPLIYKNWRITVPENPLLAAADFATRLAGAYWPVSPIPGNYFNENEINGGASTQTSTALNVINQLTGGFLGPILNITRNPSQIFLANTGNGQRSALFANINYNRYQPSYEKNYGGLLGVAQAVVNLAVSLINNDNGTLVGGYYVGSRNAEPSSITSPANQIPVDAFGRQIQTPVYGPSELGILYEGNAGRLNFGLAGKPLSDGGGIDGQFVWVSPKYKGAAGYHATPGGGKGSRDDEYKEISSTYEKNESTNLTFKSSSILDQTQRLVNSADNVSGISKLKHVGNAINQVSKVFHDGYKEITKGSQVVSYTDFTTGAEKGIEYCRVFTKDTPYYTYNDLQKTDGITTEGRRFNNSVLDSTFNLNIAPLRVKGSTNIVKNNKDELYAKKYMFSIENLAWRTSSRPGFTYDELPACEKGPNGGRVMWFPPYEIKFNDTSTANWTGTDFMGRPEPIYTYKNTTRTGTLSWKIIVDSPSVMNVIVEQQLKGQNKDRVNSIIDSFFAGCVKYDIYELAKKFNKIPSKDLYTYQQILSNPQATPEEIAGVGRAITKANDTDSKLPVAGTESKSDNPNTSVADYESKYKELGFYFDNDIPKTEGESFKGVYDSYVNVDNQKKYVDTSNATFNSESTFCKKDPSYCDNAKKVKEFFDTIVTSNYKTIAEGTNNFIVDSFNILKEGGEITILMAGAASAAASQTYNVGLSRRRVASVTKFLMETEIGDAKLGNFIKDKKLIIKIDPANPEGEIETIPKGELGSGFPVDCSKNITGGTGTVTSNSQIFSVNAMSCRRVKINSIVVKPNIKTPATDPNLVKDETKTIATEYITPLKPKPTVSVDKKMKEGIGKLVLRKLLTECDYFEVIQKDIPFLYDSIKEKIKYFNPAFHSMTPEGLNARLNFLNQCVRPGETIPVIGTDGKPKANDAVNTSFGAPPVLVLRIGDFYNTKIIPDSVAFSYDPLIFDLNPEGIGVQPMIVTVSMSFKMIGGHGLAKPVEQLQNALSFNYYANTEIYDERAVWTEDTSALDKKILQSILDGEVSAKVSDVQNKVENNGGTTIGDVITNIPVQGGQEGEIGYQKIMDKLLDNSKTYFTTLTNQLEKVVLTSNYGVLQLLNQNRLYSGGTINQRIAQVNTPKNINIWGKGGGDTEPTKLQGAFDNLFNLAYTQIEDKTNPLIKKMSEISGIDDSNLMRIQYNLTDYLKRMEGEFSNSVFTTMQDIVNQEQDFVQVIRKVNLISGKVDGKIIDTGVPRVYNISGITDNGENSEDELSKDIGGFFETMKEFDTFVTKENIVTSTYTETGNFRPINSSFIGGDNNQMTPEKVFFMIISRILNDKDKKEKFKTDVMNSLTNVTSPVKLTKKFDKYTDDLADDYNKELKDEEKLFTKFKKTPEYKNFTEGIETKMYKKGKPRKFKYDTFITPQNGVNSDLIKNLYSTVNLDTDAKTFNGKIKFD
jgi:hypothetical protein